MGDVEARVIAYASEGALLFYCVLFIAAIIENVFPPFPGDTVTVLGAYVAISGGPSIWGVFVSATMGGFLGIMLIYYLGRSRGRDFFAGRRGKIFNVQRLERIESWYEKYGTALIVFSRFFAGTRSAITLAAGLSRISVTRMSICSLAGFIIWNATLIGLVYLVKANYHEFAGFISMYSRTVTALILLVLAAYLGWRWRKRRTRATG